MNINFSEIFTFTKVKVSGKFHVKSLKTYKVIKILWFCLHFHIEAFDVKGQKLNKKYTS